MNKLQKQKLNTILQKRLTTDNTFSSKDLEIMFLGFEAAFDFYVDNPNNFDIETGMMESFAETWQKYWIKKL